MGTLLSSFFWTYAVFQFPSGYLVDRFGIPAGYGAAAPDVEDAPCHGQVTFVPTTIPSGRGPPRWVQMGSIAWNVPLTLKSAILFPPAATASPGAIC